MNHKLLLLALLSCLITVPAAAQDDTKKRQGKRGDGRGLAAQFLKQLEPAKLTDEQTAKVKEMGAEAYKKMASYRELAEITPELMKKRAAAVKAMKDSDKKGKERVALINKEAGLNEAQATAYQNINKARMDFQRKALALLSDEQKAALPEKLKKNLQRGQKGKDAKKEPAKV
ncbi:MAG: hypothetical protein AAGG48_10705 [Planctomycetota bacterium]